MSPAPVASLAVPVPGGRLGVVRLGVAPPGAPVVLALHGITANSRGWLAVAAALAGRAELVAVDLRGRGASRSLPGPYGFAAHTGDVLAVLEALALERPVLVGHSLGAFLAAHIAARHPERLGAVLLVDGGLPLPRAVQPADPQAADAQPADPRALEQGALAPALARFALRFASREECVAWWRRHPALGGDDVDAETLAAYAEHDLIGAPPELTPSACREAIAVDAAEVAAAGADAAALEVPARMLVAPRGMLDGPDPLQPLELAQAWAAADPARRSVALFPTSTTTRS